MGQSEKLHAGMRARVEGLQPNQNLVLGPLFNPFTASKSLENGQIANLFYLQDYFKWPSRMLEHLFGAWPQRYLLPVEAYFFSEELMQKKLSLVAFFRKGDNFSSHNLVKIHWWQNNFFCVADVMVSTEGLTQERSVFMLSHFSLCLPCHHIILPRFREIWINFFPKICITLSLLQSASKGTL